MAKTIAVDPITSAEIAELRYVNDRTMPDIRRTGRGQGYIDANGHAISSREVIQRITSLAIPPAWREVRRLVSMSGDIAVDLEAT